MKKSINEKSKSIVENIDKEINELNEVNTEQINSEVVKKEKGSKMKGLLYGIFIVYILVVLKLILFKNLSIFDMLRNGISTDFRSVNFMPFESIMGAINYTDSLRIFSNVFGNIAIFMPLGYFIPLLFKRMDKFSAVLFISFNLSVGLEVIQYLFAIGVTDVDDVILNVSGGILGYLVYILLKKIISKEIKLYRITAILSVVCFVLGFGIAKARFGDILGLNKDTTLYVGNENIPEGLADYFGEVTEVSEGKLEINTLDTNASVSGSETIDINDKTQIYEVETIFGEEDEVTRKYSEISIKDILERSNEVRAEIWCSGDSRNAEIIVFNEIEKDILENDDNIFTTESVVN